MDRRSFLGTVVGTLVPVSLIEAVVEPPKMTPGMWKLKCYHALFFSQYPERLVNLFAITRNGLRIKAPSPLKVTRDCDKMVMRFEAQDINLIRAFEFRGAGLIMENQMMEEKLFHDGIIQCVNGDILRITYQLSC